MNFEFGFAYYYDAAFFEFFDYFHYGSAGFFFGFCACTDHFSRVEDECGGFGSFESEDEAWELFGSVFDAWIAFDNGVEVDFLVECGGGDDVFDLYYGFAFRHGFHFLLLICLNTLYKLLRFWL